MMDYQALKEQLQLISSLKGLEYFEKFFDAWGYPRATFDRIKANDEQSIHNGVYISKQAFIMDTNIRNLYSVLGSLQKNNVVSSDVRFIFVTNESDLLAFDQKTFETLAISKEKVFSRFEFFFPLIGRENANSSPTDSVTIQVAEQLASIYNELILQNGKEKEHEIQNFICSLVWLAFTDNICFYGECHSVRNILSTYNAETNEFFRQLILDMWGLMTIEGYSPHLSVNYWTSKNVSEIADWKFDNITYTNAIRSKIYDVIALDWSNVSPEVLGAILQDATDRGISCYTTSENIHKVVGPLFLDELYQCYEDSKDDVNGLTVLGNRIQRMHIMDPACGAGNFLIEVYRELSQLTRYINERLTMLGAQSIDDFSWKNIHGIENTHFASQMAALSLSIAIYQNESVLPCPLTVDIREENPLVVEWDVNIPDDSEVYIIGNPPYRGAKKQTPKQKKDKEKVFSEYEKCAELDYAASWFLLATKMIERRHSAFSFVTTNSLSQGEQVGLLWPKLFEHNVYIQFAYRPFKWKNNAKNSTEVTVVIFGVSSSSRHRECELFDNMRSHRVLEIGPYITPSKEIVLKRTKPLSKLPYMNKGNMPYDNGYLSDISKEERIQIISEYAEAEDLFKKLVGSEEFVNGKERWCLWIPDNKLSKAINIPPIKKRIDQCREYRLHLKDVSGRKLAERPHQFREMRYTKGYSLVVPSVSSENRKYMQIGFVGSDTIVSNLSFVIYEAEPWVFGVVASRMHLLWIRTVCGGLETRLRYSSLLGYNTFPFPSISEEQKKLITYHVKKVLAEREEISQKTYAQMYSEEGMSVGLRYEHGMLDRVIEQCYREEPFLSDAERLDFLFGYYKRLMEEENG